MQLKNNVYAVLIIIVLFFCSFYNLFSGEKRLLKEIDVLSTKKVKPKDENLRYELSKLYYTQRKNVPPTIRFIIALPETNDEITIVASEKTKKDNSWNKDTELAKLHGIECTPFKLFNNKDYMFKFYIKRNNENAEKMEETYFLSPEIGKQYTFILTGYTFLDFQKKYVTKLRMIEEILPLKETLSESNYNVRICNLMMNISDCDIFYQYYRKFPYNNSKESNGTSLYLNTPDKIKFISSRYNYSEFYENPLKKDLSLEICDNSGKINYDLSGLKLKKGNKYTLFIVGYSYHDQYDHWKEKTMLYPLLIEDAIR